MSIQRDNEKLDELICRTINTEEPQFDAEKWKQKFPGEYETLISRKKKSASHKHNVRKVIFGKRAAQIAAAAAVIAAAGLFIAQQNPPEQKLPRKENVATTPVEMMTKMSLMGAYSRGGIKGVEKQCEQAFKKVGLRPGRLSVEQMLAESNGDSKSSERTKP